MARIETYARLRPAFSTVDLIEIKDDKLMVTVPAEEGLVLNNATSQYGFVFGHIFDQTATQEEVFDLAARKIVLKCLDGFNGTLFAYGQTGSGKTHTMEGGSATFEERGIIPRSVALLFSEIANRTEEEISVELSYLEIYNDIGYDLLNPASGISVHSIVQLPRVMMSEDVQNGRFVPKNLTSHSVESEEDALALLFEGGSNRKIAETPMYSALI
eukprot:Opistho-2@306